MAFLDLFTKPRWLTEEFARLNSKLDNLEETVMAKGQELLDKFAVIETEVSETATEVGLLKTEIEELKTKVAGNAELEAAVDSVLTRADTVASGLDSLQRKVAPPEPEP